ncbi:MAG: glucosyl transferase [Ignavibacteria bacterium]|nr:glucosyl transferase [Ignavibacteria bacterium]
MPKIIRQIFFLLLLFFFFFTTLTCKRSPVEPNEFEMLWLDFEDASCTEAWFNLKLNNLPKPVRVDVYRESYLTKSFTIFTTNDTLFYIENLLPKQKYEVYVKVKGSDGKEYTSTKINFETMDTTSHEFTFEMFTFGGEIGGSVLYDVVIINENNIIAVGSIFMKDSLGNPDFQPYSIVKWDGKNWTLKKLFYNNNLIVAPIRGILVLSPNEIYLAAGSVFRWDGVSSSVKLVYSRLNLPDPNATIEKLWGNSNKSIYGIGNVGSIIFYNGTSWRRIESHTTLNINDIWGDYNPKTNEWEILAVASNRQSLNDRELLKIENLVVRKIELEPRVWPLVSVWFKSDKSYYLAGQGIYYKHWFKDKIEWKDIAEGLTTFATTSIRGNDINDVIGVGAFGDFLHFNGLSWKQYQEPYLYNGAYTKVAIKDNLVVAVGGNQISLASEAVILMGRR